MTENLVPSVEPEPNTQQPGVSQEPRPPRWLYLCAALFVLGLAVCDAIVQKLMEMFAPHDWGAVFVYLIGGCIGAQFGLLSLWGPLGIGSTGYRQDAAFAVGVFWSASWYLGGLLLTRYGFAALYQVEYLGMVCCLPLILCVTQLPLWVLRLAVGLQMKHKDCSGPLRAPQMSIRGLWWTMAYVGGALAAAKGGLGFIVNRDSVYMAVESELRRGWIGLGWACLGGLGVSILVYAPVALIVWLPRSWQKGAWWGLGYVFVCWSIVGVIWWANTRFPFVEAFPLSLLGLFFGFASCLLLPLIVVRLAGYRLFRGAAPPSGR